MSFMYLFLFQMHFQVLFQAFKITLAVSRELRGGGKSGSFNLPRVLHESSHWAV